MKPLLTLALGLLPAITAAKPVEEKWRTDFRNHYCAPSEKVGRELKSIPRPGLSIFKEIPETEISEKEIAPYKALALRYFSEPKIIKTRAWRISDKKGIGDWLLVTFEMDTKDKGEEPLDYALCAYTLVGQEGKKPQPLFSPCVPSNYDRSEPQNLWIKIAPRGLEPYDYWDADGDGKPNVVLKEVVGYSAALLAYKLKDDAWVSIASDCRGGP